LPLPDPDPETVIQPAVVEADQVQPACVVTPIVPVVVDAGTISVVGENVYEQARFCVTVNVDPAIVIVPVRLVVPVFAATVYVAVPFPLPVDEVTIHGAPLTAVHAQPAAALTVMLPEPAADEND
jgi:hypothetical protein